MFSLSSKVISCEACPRPEHISTLCTQVAPCLRSLSLCKFSLYLLWVHNMAGTQQTKEALVPVKVWKTFPEKRVEQQLPARGSVAQEVKAQVLDEMRAMRERKAHTPMGFCFLCTLVTLSLLIYAAIYQTSGHFPPTSPTAWGSPEG